MFFNPAGNAFNDKFEMMGGAFLVLRPTARLDGQNPYPGEGYSADMKKAPYWFGYGYGVLSLSKDVKLSAGFWSPKACSIRTSSAWLSTQPQSPFDRAEL